MKKLFFIILFFIVAATNTAGAYETKATYAVLMDYDSGRILYQKEADVAMKPSSMTKMMTSYVVFDRLQKKVLKLEDEFTVSEKAWRQQGSKAFVGINERLSIDTLLQGIIVVSGNDSCTVIAEGISGDEETFARLMTETGKKIGLTNSNFLNSTGWPDEGHYMSARDLAILSRALIMQFPEYYHYFAQADFTHNKIKQPNRNLLLYRNIGVDGLKTGHTQDAGYGIAVSAVQNGKRLVAVVNGLTSELERADEAERLLNYGYKSFETKTLYNAGQAVESAAVWQGAKETVALAPKTDVSLTVPIILDAPITVELKYNAPLVAPVAKDTQVGDMIIHIPGMDPVTVPLVTAESVERAGWFQRVINNAKRL